MQRVALVPMGKVAFGPKMCRAYHVLINGADSGIAHLVKGVYHYNNFSGSRKRLLEVLRA